MRRLRLFIEERAEGASGQWSKKDRSGFGLGFTVLADNGGHLVDLLGQGFLEGCSNTGRSADHERFLVRDLQLRGDRHDLVAEQTVGHGRVDEGGNGSAVNQVVIALGAEAEREKAFQPAKIVELPGQGIKPWRGKGLSQRPTPGSLETPLPRGFECVVHYMNPMEASDSAV